MIEPKTSATVITLQTSLQPQNKTFLTSIVIADGQARSSDEVDRWRLFDLAQNRVRVVDDLSKTYYTTKIDKAAEVAGAPQIIATGAKKPILGVEATQYVIRLGAFQRELWMGSPQQIPQNLYGMVDNNFAKIPGFPLVDHAELPYGTTKLVVDRTVLKIEQRDVPQDSLTIPSDYQEVTAPGARRPPASSPPGGQSTRVAG
ncbi:MAG TPA: hypothetical protein VER58_18175 [Thermoanaerobaculia bacterium]|nr:hypothetical protein [Thermoanaerobaculia bacterium]